MIQVKNRDGTAVSLAEIKDFGWIKTFDTIDVTKTYGITTAYQGAEKIYEVLPATQGYYIGRMDCNGSYTLKIHKITSLWGAIELVGYYGKPLNFILSNGTWKNV